MKRLLLRGPFLTQSGYGVHARQVAKAVFEYVDNSPEVIEVHTQLLSWGLTPWITSFEGNEGILIKRLLQNRIAPTPTVEEPYDVTIQLQLPNEWSPDLGKYNIGITAGVETHNVNPEWVSCCNKMDHVVVPSEFTKTCFFDTGKVETKKFEVIPESFFDAILRQDDIPPLDIEEIKTDFNFLVFGQITGNNPENDRKNLAYTVKWFAELFANQPEIGIIIKSNFGRMTSVDKLATIKLFSQLYTETRKGAGPTFYLIHGSMTEEELVGLYKNPKIKAIVSLTRGEGFNLPVLEAAACGLPAMVTNWSAHTEYLSLGKYIKFDYTLEPIHESREDGMIFMKGAKWAQCKEEDVKLKLSKFVKSPILPRTWAKELKPRILEKYNPEVVTKQWMSLLNSVFTTTDSSSAKKE